MSMGTQGRRTATAPPPVEERAPVGVGGIAPMARPTGSLAVAIQLATATTIARPRVIETCLERATQEAALLGDDFFYAWRVKDRTSETGYAEIKGVSIDGAMALLRAWRNATCLVELASETPTHWTFNALFVDFEDGFAVPRLFRQRKGQNLGKMDDARAEDLVFQIGQSKCQRNAILKGLSPGFVRQVMKAAEANSEKALSAEYKGDLGAANQAAINAFGADNVTVEQLEKRLGAPVAKWTWKHHVQLLAIDRAITAGETTILAEFFDDAPPAAEPEAAPVVEAAAPAAAATGGGGYQRAGGGRGGPAAAGPAPAATFNTMFPNGVVGATGAAAPATAEKPGKKGPPT